MSLTDLKQFSGELMARRNKATMLLTTDLREQHNCAAQLAAAIGAPHLDLLDCFQADAGLNARLGAFTMDDFLALVAARVTQPFIVVSGVEFLLAAWLSQDEPKQVRRDFCFKLEHWEGRPAFILVAQHDPLFAGYQPRRHTGLFAIELSQVKAFT
jgi:hypothetical protein